MTAEPISSLITGPKGNPSDLLYWPRLPTEGDSPPTPKVVVLFIPGNPGLVNYYASFLTKLQTTLPAGSTTVYALGHLSHSIHEPPSYSGSNAVTLREQVDHKVKFVDELATKHKFTVEEGGPGARLVLMGHSIGSWVCCEVLKARPHLVSSLHLLFPTISHMSTTPNGRRLSALFTPYLLPPVAAATAFLSYLPQALLLPVVKLLAGQSGPGADVTTSLVSSPGTVVSALSMAREEMTSVTDLDKDVLRRHGGRMWFYWAKGDDDGWVSASSIDEIEETLEAAKWRSYRRFRCEEGMQHAFILTSKHSDSLATRCAGWIKDEFLQDYEE